MTLHVGELAKELDVSYETARDHLTRLMDGGYITRIKSGVHQRGIFEVERPDGAEGEQGSAREAAARVLRWG